MRTLATLISTIILLLIDSTYAESLSAEQTDQLFIHPLCLDQVLHPEAGTEMPETIECNPDSYEMPVSVNRNDGAKPFFSVERARDENESYFGAVGYQVAERLPLKPKGQFAVLEVTDNTGGSGQFSSLWMLFRKEAEARYEVFNLAGGGVPGSHDRCNDGNFKYLSRAGNILTYSSSATPFRLLNPVDKTNWRFAKNMKLMYPSIEIPASFQDWKAYDDIENSASSCVGQIIRQIDFDEETESVIGIRFDAQAFIGSTQGKHQQCVNDWLKTSYIPNHPDVGDGWVPLHEWQAALKSLEAHCQKDEK